MKAEGEWKRRVDVNEGLNSGQQGTGAQRKRMDERVEIGEARRGVRVR